MNTATGTFTIKAEWSGNATISTLTNTTTLSLLPYDNQYAFYVESNSTISELSFNKENNELTFNVTGPSETMGYVKVTMPTSLTGIDVYIDGKQQAFSLTSNENSVSLTFTYSHNIHSIDIVLGPANSGLLLYIIIVVALVAFLLGALLYTRRKRNRKLRA